MVKQVKERMDESETIKTVIKTQKLAFQKTQKVIEIEESVTISKNITETERIVKEEESRQCRVQFNAQKSDVDRLTKQLEAVEK